MLFWGIIPPDLWPKITFFRFCSHRVRDGGIVEARPRHEGSDSRQPGPDPKHTKERQ